jgi:hypothetical protein
MTSAWKYLAGLFALVVIASPASAQGRAQESAQGLLTVRELSITMAQACAQAGIDKVADRLK